MFKLATSILAAFLLMIAPAASAEPLDINTATVEQLDEVLVGVGMSKAKAIVADREKNGKFASVDDLVRVKGIGPATLEKNRSKITVGGGIAERPAVSDGAPAKVQKEAAMPLPKAAKPAISAPTPMPAAPAAAP